MMKQLFLSSTLIACILLSCNSPKTENNGPQTFHIDLNAANKKLPSGERLNHFYSRFLSLTQGEGLIRAK